MSQQTQLSRVVPAYHRFLGLFPDPSGCASAPLGDVLIAWEGMGYNRRARDLHRTARIVVAEHGGAVPDDLEALLALPGVGPYTARAVLAFAFERDVGVIDTNAGRILSRAVSGSRLRPAAAQALVDAMVPAGRGWSFGQALLDLGATVCTARAPACPACPLRRRCAWSGSGWPDDAARAGRIAEGLVAEGLAVRDGTGTMRLP
jgi:A/G-specific adenine glycosylase